MSNNLTIRGKDIVTNAKANAKSIINSLDITEPTRQDYLYRIPLFLDFIKKNGIGFNTFLDYKRFLEKRTDIKLSTKNKYLQTARIFLKETHRQGRLPVDITANIKGWTQEKKHKKEGLSNNDILALVEKLRELPTTPKNARLKALFSLLSFQGLRQVEITRLNVEDLDLKSHTALIQGKGKADKELIHLHPETTKTIAEHIRVNRVGSGALFKSLGNRHSERINAITIKREIKNILTPLGIEKSTHGFRHYYITTLLKKLDVRDVRKFSRHSNLEMLIVYDDELDIKNKTGQVFNLFQGLSLSM